MTWIDIYSQIGCLGDNPLLFEEDDIPSCGYASDESDANIGIANDAGVADNAGVEDGAGIADGAGIEDNAGIADDAGVATDEDVTDTPYSGRYAFPNDATDEELDRMDNWDDASVFIDVVRERIDELANADVDADIMASGPEDPEAPCPDDSRVFSSMTLLWVYCESFAKSSGYTVAKRRTGHKSGVWDYTTVICNRGHPESAYREDHPEVLRKSTSCNCNCPLKWTMKAVVGGFQIVVHNNHHNHCIRKEELLASLSCCRLTPEERVYVEELHDNHTKPLWIFRAICIKFPDTGANLETVRQ
ncbi:hypothetical protein H4S07_002710 [Coemansia furcata]|uniref:Uncharacterized protein n=1 Tax=Coemansia furcata TaxID=417177 RepID=A0ACC1LKN0_9FUNG|nr:hypothetical protein H4S07_002710 [Coemansia furcata]